MTRVFSAFLLLLLAGAAFAQGRSLTLNLKSGETLDGHVKVVDEDGIKLDIGDGIELYIRWAYTRGDKHFELRKTATDFSKLPSVLKLADFCHDFAMDKEEYVVLTQALKVDARHKEARDRLLALPKVDGVDVPQIPDDKPLPPPTVERPPKEAKPTPKTDKPPSETPKEEPKSNEPVKIIFELSNDDAVALEWFKKEFDRLGYKIGGRKDHDVSVKIDLSLTLERAPSFMGQTLYAIYDGSASWSVSANGEKSPFARDSSKSENVRRDTKAAALSACRNDLMRATMDGIHAAIKKRP